MPWHRRLLITAPLALAACAPAVKPVLPPKVITVPVDHYVPVPAELTTPCLIPEPTLHTVGEAVSVANARKQSLITCNNQLDAIRKLGTQP